MSFGILPSNISSTVLNYNYSGGSAYQVGALTVWRQQLYYNKAPVLAITDHFDPTYSASNYSFSADELTCTTLGSSGSCRNLLTHSTGKFYVEFQKNDNVADMRFGVGLTSFNPSNCIGRTTEGVGFSVQFGGGANTWSFNNSSVASTLPALGVGGWVGLAFDLHDGSGNLNCWVCNPVTNPSLFYGNGGVGDPVAETNPFQVASFNSPMLVYVGNNGNHSGIVTPMNNATFVGFPPTGYQGWAANETPDNDPTHWGLVAPVPPPATFANLSTNLVPGCFAVITDSSTAVLGAVIAGGGANEVLGVYDGTNWRVGVVM